MNFKQLEAFVRVAELQSFTRAARQLYMSQPAVSFQIKSLEESLGATLFLRGDKKVILTEAGHLLYPEARQMLRHYQKIKEGLAGLRGLQTGHLLVGASTIPGEYLLPLLIGGFKEHHPGVQVTLKVAGSGQVDRWLKEREIDLGITGAPVAGEGLTCLPWLGDELVLIVPPGHPLYGRQSATVEELLAGPLILREPGSGTRRTLESKLNEKGYALDKSRVVMELGSTRAVITAVQAGRGASVVSLWAANDLLALGRVHRVNDVDGLDLTRRFYVTHGQDWLGSFVTKAFIEYITAGEVCRLLLKTE
ncbi:selenium metabolism-associated LysR family transcriptional regulator [Desulfotomaculum copahuensis]|uniref:Transcriptional regulator n=1 Tax=Desulfotomaculum copahuensis TaxID=1838280 RepID=A0A1B7LE62_9FIRM|nr:selenium metabolism-associated LysR family transcriptional regulator [Desulfotomaculum copahuensis]OAT81389.1 transcriptional regulator [Desulfotomaculum copahuensis]